MFDEDHLRAFRLFNGFTEGRPQLVIDLYAGTAVVQNYADPPEEGLPLVEQAHEFLRERLPWLKAILLKTRSSTSLDERRGRLLMGTQPATRIKEQRIWYALDLTLTQDSSFYLDTRYLRRWATENLARKSVLNAFSYTGSLGRRRPRREGPARLQLDRDGRFLKIARQSCALNGFAVKPADFIEADFFRQAGAFRRLDRRFDCVFIDPPVFSTSPGGVVDQIHESERLIKKVKPLVKPGGYLVAINNAVFVSGAAFMATLDSICADGYMKLADLIPVPEDFTGYPATRTGTPITDPAPFNHSTKIAILQSVTPG